MFAKERNDYEGDLSNVDAIASVIAGAEVVVTAYLHAIHPILYRSCHDAGYRSGEVLKLGIGCAMGIFGRTC